MADGVHSLGFSISVCKQYLCVARATLVFIYDICDGFPEFVSKVMCPDQVLAITMDVCSGVPTLGAILKGRTGMVFELDFDFFCDGTVSNAVSDGIRGRPDQTKSNLSNVTPNYDIIESGNLGAELNSSQGSRSHQNTQE